MSNIKLFFVCLIAFCLFPVYTNAQNLEKLILVFQDNEYQLTGVAISNSGRLFVNYPYWLEKHDYSVIEVLSDGTIKPYPDKEWNSWKKGEPGKEKFVCAQAVYIDKQDILWVVDPASPQLAGVVDRSNKLVKINLENNKVERIYYFDSSIADDTSYINDVRVDTDRQIAYLTDSSTGAILVVDLKSGKSRKLLSRHPSTLSYPEYIFKVNGRELRNANGSVKINSDGLALTPDNKFLYYKPLTDNRLYRIETVYLCDENIKPEELENKVENLGEVCSSDGLICDSKGNVYLGDIETCRIVKYTCPGKTEVILKDESLIWPDSYAISKDGYLYITCSQINLMPWFNEGKSLRTSPYQVFKIKIYGF